MYLFTYLLNTYLLNIYWVPGPVLVADYLRVPPSHGLSLMELTSCWGKTDKTNKYTYHMSEDKGCRKKIKQVRGLESARGRSEGLLFNIQWSGDTSLSRGQWAVM